MNTMKKIVQKLKELPVAQFPTEQYTTGSQILELIDKAIPNRQVVNHSNDKDEDDSVVGENCWSEIRKDIVLKENFWPNIRKHILADDPDAMPMKAICSVCWDELQVTCISTDDKLDIGLVAPCGHIMCPECWPRKIDGPRQTVFEGRRCPVCHVALECFICYKACDKVVIPRCGGKAAIKTVPETAPECGRVYRSWCKDCAKPSYQKGDGFWFDNSEEQGTPYIPPKPIKELLRVL
ncbi:hypothetical protein FPCIR_1007 [Fusarium pseudocircinatum]|uniref:RING-type domain-containing protein n=1 Tax=Fusarium pseudocircinatum TaxID=56676 RepID=A0A8H5PXQ5_9HYPO|nr:hypothetical protein FPCIR_1007 [Fusarium pseudocircinatum]